MATTGLGNQNIQNIPYFVTDNFALRYAPDDRQMRNVEIAVEGAYQQRLFSDCSWARRQKQAHVEKSRYARSAAKRNAMLERAESIDLRDCRRYEELFGNKPFYGRGW